MWVSTGRLCAAIGHLQHCLSLFTADGVAWVLFLEKAFAQLFGNYCKLQNRDPYLPLQCLTGEMELLPLVPLDPDALGILFKDPMCDCGRAFPSSIVRGISTQHYLTLLEA